MIQVIAEASGEVLYSIRVRGSRFQPGVYSEGVFTVKVGRDRPDRTSLSGLKASVDRQTVGTKRIKV